MGINGVKWGWGGRFGGLGGDKWGEMGINGVKWG